MVEWRVMIDGLLDLTWAGRLVYALLLTHVTIVSVTLFLHRHQSHRALELHPAASHFFRFWLWLTTGIVTREWVAVHRRHHAACERRDDPHSPQIRGLRKVLWEGAELYREAAADPETLRRFGKGTPDDWLERNLYARHSTAGILLMLAIDLVLLGAAGLSVWALQMLWIPFWAAGVINGVGHYWGYRTFATPDASTNIVPWGILIGGEELHNNHHAYPDSARFSSRPCEIDIGWLYIRSLAALRLVRVKRVAPRPPRVARFVGGAIDIEAARAIVAARLLVLARYGREVLARVHRDELCRSGDRRVRESLKAASRFLRRHESLLDVAARERLRAALDESVALRTVFQFRDRLQAIWSQQAAGPEGVREALQEWCRQAEASGIEALSEFARRLGSLRPRGGRIG